MTVAMLCDACQDIFRGDLVLGISKAHQQTKNSLFEAAQNKCRICTLLWAHFSRAGQMELLSPEEDENFVFTSYDIRDSEDSSIRIPEDAMALAFMMNATLVEPDLLTRDSWSENFVYTFILPPMPDIGSLAKEAEIPSSTASSVAFRLAHEWILTCTKDHTKCVCPPESPSYYPTRLVEITQGAPELRIRMTDKNPPEGPYMTLSHRWGTTKFIKLTTSNFEILQNGFSLSEIPKTFRDAIFITQKIGANYLWIDSLCIIQDSVADWRREAAVMGDIYRNSFCNVAATGASNSDQGCFAERNPSMMSPCTVSSSWTDASNQTYLIVETDFLSQVYGAPLNRRAWVVQERLLAPRILHFGREQLFWECHELEACETFPQGLPLGLGGTGFKGMDPHVDGRRIRLEEGRDPDPTLNAYHLWDQVVKAYTWSDLTKPEDKLIALSGLAKTVQHMVDDEYLAGLWKSILPSQLLWEVYDTKQGDGRPSVRSSSYRAPSWSWASLNGCVGFLIISRTGIMVTIIEAHVSPSTNDTTGQLESGFIRLRGDLFAAEIDSKEPTELGLRIGLYEFAKEKSTVVPDVRTDDTSVDFYCLPLIQDNGVAKSSGSDYSWIYGLILRSVVGKKGVYQRFGTFHLDGCEAREVFATQKAEDQNRDGLYDDVEQRTLTLI